MKTDESQARIDVVESEEIPEIHSSDARLIEEIRQGNRNAFRGLVLRYEKKLFRVIHRFVRNESLTEDLAQETFIRVYENLEQFDLSRRFGPWLFRVGVNLTLDYLRKQKRRGSTPLFSEINPEKPLDPLSVDPRHNSDLSEEIQFVLMEIPEKYRTVLVLRDLEHFTSAEVAAIVQRKETTIRWRLAEARNRFKELWVKRVGESSLLQTEKDGK